MQKIFNQSQQCPFGKSCLVDSSMCRNCKHYFGAAGYLFIRCTGTNETSVKEKAKEPEPNNIIREIKRKPGRPRGASKGPKKRSKKK